MTDILIAFKAFSKEDGLLNEKKKKKHKKRAESYNICK